MSEKQKNWVFWKAKPSTSVIPFLKTPPVNFPGLGFVPSNDFALTNGSRKEGGANVTLMSKKCGEGARVLQDRHLASGVSRRQHIKNKISRRNTKSRGKINTTFIEESHCPQT